MPLPALYREHPADFIGVAIRSPRTREAGAYACNTRAFQPWTRSLGNCTELPSPSVYAHYYTDLPEIAQVLFFLIQLKKSYLRTGVYRLHSDQRGSHRMDAEKCRAGGSFVLTAQPYAVPVGFSIGSGMKRLPASVALSTQTSLKPISQRIFSAVLNSLATSAMLCASELTVTLPPFSQMYFSHCRDGYCVKLDSPVSARVYRCLVLTSKILSVLNTALAAASAVL